MSADALDWAIPDEKIADSYRKIKKILEERDKTIFVDWSRPVLEEITPNVQRY